MTNPTDLIRRGDAITAAAKVEQPPYPRSDAGEAAIYSIGFTAGRRAVETALRARQMNAELPEATRDMLKLKGMI